MLLLSAQLLISSLAFIYPLSPVLLSASSFELLPSPEPLPRSPFPRISFSPLHSSPPDPLPREIHESDSEAYFTGVGPLNAEPGTFIGGFPAFLSR